ncbi:hypothetical protein TrVGV298_012081 [Trichoderma virens]|nr:hypothetical protein TrVGV298_012081 [Trichoderma virens]
MSLVPCALYPKQYPTSPSFRVSLKIVGASPGPANGDLANTAWDMKTNDPITHRVNLADYKREARELFESFMRSADVNLLKTHLSDKFDPNSAEHCVENLVRLFLEVATLVPLSYISFYEPRTADTIGSAVVNEDEKAAIDIDIPDDENSDEEHEVPSGFLLGGHG